MKLIPSVVLIQSSHKIFKIKVHKIARGKPCFCQRQAAISGGRKMAILGSIQSVSSVQLAFRTNFQPSISSPATFLSLLLFGNMKLTSQRNLQILLMKPIKFPLLPYYLDHQLDYNLDHHHEKYPTYLFQVLPPPSIPSSPSSLPPTLPSLGRQLSAGQRRNSLQSKLRHSGKWFSMTIDPPPPHLAFWSPYWSQEQVLGVLLLLEGLQPQSSNSNRS